MQLACLQAFSAAGLDGFHAQMQSSKNHGLCSTQKIQQSCRECITYMATDRWEGMPPGAPQMLSCLADMGRACGGKRAPRKDPCLLPAALPVSFPQTGRSAHCWPQFPSPAQSAVNNICVSSTCSDQLDNAKLLSMQDSSHTSWQEVCRSVLVVFGQCNVGC
jgi:hypothetical protein